MPLNKKLFLLKPSLIAMKLPKVLLGAILVGIAVQATGCNKKDLPGPKEESGKKTAQGEKPTDSCPACGRG